MPRRYTRREIMSFLLSGGAALLVSCNVPPSDSALSGRVSVTPTHTREPKTPTTRANTPIAQHHTPIPPTHTASPVPSTATATPEAEVSTPTPTATSQASPTITRTATSTGWYVPTEPRITPNDEFYTMKYNPSDPPEVEASDYRLIIEGEVDNPLSLSLEDLKAYPSISQMRTLQCIGNPIGGNLIGNAEWVGLSLAALLKEAGIRSRGRFLKLESLDGYHTGIPRKLALHQDSLLAYQMNGQPLPAKHGYPLRCLFPGRYGQKQPKWITRITAQSQAHTGHWEGQGWSDDAFILPGSRIEMPSDNGAVKSDFVISGIAVTDDSGLEQLEVSIDDGVSWQVAELLRGPNPYVWTMWWLNVEGVEAGVYRILARTTDGNGYKQSRKKKLQIFDVTFPDGNDYMHELSVSVVS